jgi:SAM-dependent methyltransferase
MRHSIKQFVQIAAQTLPLVEPIIEFGSYQVPGQEGLADLRCLFPGKRYVGADMRAGRGVDCALDLHRLGLADRRVGTALCLDTLEHVEYPHRAMEEVHRVLEPGGIVVVSSVMKFPIHDYPYDYWRFTPEAFRSLLKPFTQAYVDSAGDDLFPHTVVGLGVKGAQLPLDAFLTRMGPWKARWTAGWHWMPIVRPWVPPIVIDAYIRFHEWRRGVNPSG